MITIERARRLREIIEAASASLSDEYIAEAPSLLPAWSATASYSAGDLVRHGGTPYRCLQAHQAQAGWEPEAAPSLWAEVLPGQGGTDIGEWVQPDSTNPYMKGDHVMHNGVEWVSDIDNNVWEPGVYGWSEVTQ